jgi:hypothetical protein
VKVLEADGTQAEYLLGADNIFSQEGIEDKDGVWVVQPDSFTASGLTICLVPRAWFEAGDPEAFPPCLRMTFSRTVRTHKYGQRIFVWSGNGAELILRDPEGETDLCLMEGDNVQITEEVSVELEAVKGRSTVRLRVHKPREMLAKRMPR